VPERETRLKQAVALLRARMDLRGTTLNWLGGARDDLWWLMVSPDLNAARALAVLQNVPEMQAELPRIARGLMARQKQGHWDLTTANAWARIALDRSTSSGRVGERADARRTRRGKPHAELAETAGRRAAVARDTSELHLTQQGSGKPWSR
jgi:hypothetical protein